MHTAHIDSKSYIFICSVHVCTYATQIYMHHAHLHNIYICIHILGFLHGMYTDCTSALHPSIPHRYTLPYCIFKFGCSTHVCNALCAFPLQCTYICSMYICDRYTVLERWGAGVETQKNVRGEIGGWGRVPFNEPYAPLLSTIYDGA